MNECQYLYALSDANIAHAQLGPGVDPRFNAEMAACGRLTAVVSRVGLDQFDPAKLQAQSADVAWLSQVAVRHNTIVDALARRAAVLPLRLGTIFNSRDSMAAQLAKCETQVIQFLRRLGDRQEWAVKAYCVEPQELAAAGAPCDVSSAAGLGGSQADGGHGTQYLIAKRREVEMRQRLLIAQKQELLALQQGLSLLVDGTCALRLLPKEITGRDEKMLWNGAFLVSRERQPRFRRACDELSRGFPAKGLTVEVTGPWPAYHFCPALEY